MTPEELQTQLTTVSEELNATYELAEQLFIEGIYDLKQYADIGIVPDKNWYNNNKSILFRNRVESKMLNELYTIEELTESLKEFEETHTQLKVIGKSKIESEEDIGDGYISFIGFNYYYYTLNKDALASVIQTKSRQLIAKLLKPDSIEDGNEVTAECAIVKLFLDGNIDWNTLQTITYKGCEL